MSIKRKKFGFTLAEVLIALTIVGIIAALTIPTLIEKTHEREVITRVKKAYANLTTAYTSLVEEYSDIQSALSDSPLYYVGDIFASKMKVAINCGRSGYSSITGCFPNVIYKRLDGTNYYYDFSTNDSFNTILTSDSMAYAFYGDKNCDDDGSRSHSTTAKLYNSLCTRIYVDIDGPNKGPSMIGRDMFVFELTKYGVYPMGFTFDDGDIGYGADDCTIANPTGLSCAAKIVQEDSLDYLNDF